MPPCFAKQNATTPVGAEDLPPCFAKQNATTPVGAEDLPPCFALLIKCAPDAHFRARTVLRSSYLHLRELRILPDRAF